MRVLAYAWFLVVLLAGAVACAVTPTSGGPTTRGGQEEATDSVRIGLTEWSVHTSAEALRPGEVSVQVTNAGAMQHDVLIRGALGVWGTPMLAPGAQHTMTIETQAGELLELLCTVAGHDAFGMRGELAVADEAPS